MIKILAVKTRNLAKREREGCDLEGEEVVTVAPTYMSNNCVLLAVQEDPHQLSK